MVQTLLIVMRLLSCNNLRNCNHLTRISVGLTQLIQSPLTTNEHSSALKEFQTIHLCVVTNTIAFLFCFCILVVKLLSNVIEGGTLCLHHCICLKNFIKQNCSVLSWAAPLRLEDTSAVPTLTKKKKISSPSLPSQKMCLRVYNPYSSNKVCGMQIPHHSEHSCSIQGNAPISSFWM